MGRRLGVLVFAVAVFTLFCWAGVRNLRARRAAVQHAEGEHLTVQRGDGGLTLTDSGAPAGPGAALIGKPAPTFTLTDTAGKKVSLADLKGHAVVVNFWATWCGPCKQEMPWFEELSKKYAAEGLVVLGLDQDDGMGRDELATNAKKIGVSYAVGSVDDSTDKAYGGIDFLPQTFYIDKAGRVVQATAGGRPKDEIDADIQKTLAAGAL